MLCILTSILFACGNSLFQHYNIFSITDSKKRRKREPHTSVKQQKSWHHLVSLLHCENRNNNNDGRIHWIYSALGECFYSRTSIPSRTPLRVFFLSSRELEGKNNDSDDGRAEQKRNSFQLLPSVVIIGSRQWRKMLLRFSIYSK